MPRNWNDQYRDDYRRGSNDDRDYGFGRGDMQHTGDYGYDRDSYRNQNIPMYNDRQATHWGWDPSRHQNRFERDYRSRFRNYDDQYYGTMGRDNNFNDINRADFRGRGPKNYRRSDDRIREDACEALERDPYVDASEVEVDVKDGIVTLRGNVDDRRTKRHAEECVEMCSGVKDVRNELVVDQSFWQRAKAALLGENTETKGTNPKH